MSTTSYLPERRNLVLRSQSMELLREHLLESIDGLRDHTQKWFTGLAEVPMQTLQAPVVSTWGSIFGILSHVQRGTTIFTTCLSGVPADTSNWYGTCTTFDEYVSKTTEINAEFFRVVEKQKDLREQVYLQFIRPKDGGFWLRAPFHRFVGIALEHALQHHGHVDGMLRELGIKLPVNPTLEYMMAPPPGAYIRHDSKNYPEPDSIPKFEPPAELARETWESLSTPEKGPLRGAGESTHPLPRPPLES